MTETQKTLTPPPTAARNNTRSILPLVIATLLISILIAGAGFYVWQSLINQERSLRQYVDTRNTKFESGLSSFEKSNKSQANTTKESLQKLLDNQLKLGEQLRFNTQKLALIGGSSRTDWLLSEAEYLLRLGNQRLGIEHDSKGTEHILIAADKVLEEIDDPALLPIRVALAEEIYALQRISGIDTQGIYAKLNALTQNLNTLSQVTPKNKKLEQGIVQKQIEASEPITRSVLEQVWSDLKQAVSIQRMDNKVEPLLTPEQEHYLKLNLRLMLEQASLSVLNYDDQSYQSSLDKAQAWLTRYFNLKDKQVTKVNTTISELRTLTLTATLPDISQSLRLLKAHIESMYRNHSLNKLHVDNSKQATEAAQ